MKTINAKDSINNTHLVDVVLEMPPSHFWNPQKHNFSTCIISN